MQRADCKLCMDFSPPRARALHSLFVDPPSLFIHSEDGHLVCVQVLGVLSRAAMKCLVLICGAHVDGFQWGVHPGWNAGSAHSVHTCSHE